jgi:plasmid stabilization system protein ParE
MFEIELSDFALLDFEEAYLWYEEQRSGLGDDMLLCFEESIEIIKRNPHFEIRGLDVRVLNIRRFPYQIVYRIIENKIRIVAFFHAKRNPSVWKKRK